MYCSRNSNDLSHVLKGKTVMGNPPTRPKSAEEIVTIAVPALYRRLRRRRPLVHEKKKLSSRSQLLQAHCLLSQDCYQQTINGSKGTIANLDLIDGKRRLWRGLPKGFCRANALHLPQAVQASDKELSSIILAFTRR